MAKSSKRGSKSSKLVAAKADGTAISADGKIAPRPQKASTANVSDELRQAVMDLGGDEEDLELIAGIDSDEEEDSKAKAGDEPKSIGEEVAQKGKESSDEVSIDVRGIAGWVWWLIVTERAQEGSWGLYERPGL